MDKQRRLLYVLLLLAGFGLIWGRIGVFAQAGPTIGFGDSIGFVYQPATITVDPGTTVTWAGSFSSHPLASNDNLWTIVSSGPSFSYTFTQPGTYPYYCIKHGTASGQGMAGVVVVKDSAQVTATASATVTVTVPPSITATIPPSTTPTATAGPQRFGSFLPMITR